MGFLGALLGAGIGWWLAGPLGLGRGMVGQLNKYGRDVERRHAFRFRSAS